MPRIAWLLALDSYNLHLGNAVLNLHACTGKVKKSSVSELAECHWEVFFTVASTREQERVFGISHADI